MRRLFASVAVILVIAASSVRAADSHRSAKSIDEALEHADEVETLSLKGPVPKEVERLVNLRELQARGPLPDEPLHLPQLSILRLNGTKVTRLPDWLGSLTSLKKLDLSGAALTALPHSIGQLGNLEQLDLSDTKLESLPAELGKLKKVSRLRLSRTRLLKFLPPELGGMASLETLLADGSGLEAVPPELGDLALLRTADFAATTLHSFPFPAFAKLPALEWLDLGLSHLDFPSKLGALEGAGSLFRRIKADAGAKARSAPLAGPAPTDPKGIRERVLKLAKTGARAELVRLLQKLGWVPEKDADTGRMVDPDAYVDENTTVDVDLFFAELLGEPPGVPAEKEAVLQIRTSGQLTGHYYALGLFAQRKGEWKMLGSIEEDRRADGASLTFKFVPLFKKEGRSAIQGILRDANLRDNDRSEVETVVIWKVTESGAIELAREVYSRSAYESNTSKARVDEVGSFSLDIKEDSAQLVIKQTKQGGKRQTRVVKLDLHKG